MSLSEQSLKNIYDCDPVFGIEDTDKAIASRELKIKELKGKKGKLSSSLKLIRRGYRRGEVTIQELQQWEEEVKTAHKETDIVIKILDDQVKKLREGRRLLKARCRDVQQ